MRHVGIASLLACLLIASLPARAEDTSESDPWDVEVLVVVGEASTSPFAFFEPRSYDGYVEPVFASLGEGKWIEVEYESKGCFNDSRRIVKIRGGERPEAEISTPGFFAPDPRSGVIPLSAEDLEGLDRLLAFYRTLDGGACTTRDRIVVKWRTGSLFSRTTRTEEFVDESCGTSLYSDIVTLREIVLRLPDEDAG